MTDILALIKEKEDLISLTALVVKEPELIETLVYTLENEKKAVKYNCEKILRKISEEQPNLLYQYFDRFLRLLTIDNKFIKWGIILILANLAVVDKKNKFQEFFDLYFNPVLGREMVTAANIAGNAWKICLAHPVLVDQIVNLLLKVESTVYYHKEEPSPECNNIVCGDVLVSFGKMFESSERQEEIIEFIDRQRQNSRPKVRKAAEKLYQKLSGQSYNS